MDSSSAIGLQPPDPEPPLGDLAFQRQLRNLNEALLVSSLRQHELTERAECAGALAKVNAARYLALFNSIDEGFCVVEGLFDSNNVAIDYRFLEVNPAFEKQSGLRDVIGKRARELMPDLENSWFEIYGKVAITGESIRFVNEAKSLNRWFDLNGFRLGDAESRTIAIIFTDITARMRIESRLHESEVRYRRIFESSKDGILVLDVATAKIIEANAFICALLGQELPQIVGKELWEIGLFGDISANRQVFARLKQDGYVRYDHLPIQSRSGDIHEVEFVSNVYNEGERQVAQCNIRDITARVALEREVQLQAKALADQTKHKDEFLAMLGHELRNPLAPIRSATHLLRLQESKNVNPIQRQAREVIERQVTTLTRLISDLMEVSRALTGRIRLKQETIDLNVVLRHAIETASPLLVSRGHTLTSGHCPDPIWASVDSTRMEEVFVNLLANAAKYTEPGGKIQIGCERHQNDALVRVRDNGEGIEAELLPRIFDLFTQGDRTLDRAQGGLGIGLSLAHRVVELHGGSISVHSEGPGKGSEFSVRLPIAPCPEDVQDGNVTHASIKPDGLRVLVVDDNMDACLMLANLVSLGGHGVQMAYTGPQALAAASSWKPHVILLDIGLPEIDGYEVARRIRADPSTRTTKLVAVSGYGADKDVQLGREAGFDAHFLKPVDLAEIEKLLVMWNSERASAPTGF